jgi:hypothetical protein
MKRLLSTALLLLVAVGAGAARWTHQKTDVGRIRISIYHVAPGKQLDFLRFWAAQNEIAKEAEIPPVELYAHIEGDSWDYVLLRPVTTPEQDKALDEIAVKRGVKTGVPASLAFRELLTSHTDTLAAGPMSPENLLKAAQ